jgi:hypothetical protein
MHPPIAFNFSAEILYILEYCKTQNAALIERSQLHWRRAIDISVALKQFASLNFTTQARSDFLKSRDLKASKASKSFII